MTARGTPESFWAHGRRIGACLVWPGEKDAWGYGRGRYHGRKWTVSRLAWTLAFGPIPVGLFVLHRCDNPPCFEPDHLFLGTLSDNQRDMIAKKRRRHATGERNAMVRLTDVQVREIRAAFSRGVTLTQLARQHATYPTTIRRIVTYKTRRSA